MHAYLRSLALGLALLLPAVPAFAADAPAKTDAAIPDKPTRITERNTPVAVEYEGNDSIGSRLATRVKETLNSSNLFSLTDKDTPKIRILIATQPEFKDRPGVGLSGMAASVLAGASAAKAGTAGSNRARPKASERR